MNKTLSFLILILTLAFLVIYYSSRTKTVPEKHTPLVAIANYGPHSSLEDIIIGIKSKLEVEGFIENQNIKYLISDVAFDSSMILQMISNLKGQRPDLIVTITTPVSQLAKSQIKNIPLVFSGVTDPVISGLIKSDNVQEENITGCSEKQDLSLMIDFAKKLIPNAKSIGVLYSTSEINDTSMLKNLRETAEAKSIKVIAIGIENPRDIPTRMNGFKGNVDFIYVGTSGTIQPALPAIANIAIRMNIPIINADKQAVIENMVLASFGVDYKAIGINTGNMVTKILRGAKIQDLPPLHPDIHQHEVYISAKKAKQENIEVPAEFQHNKIGE